MFNQPINLSSLLFAALIATIIILIIQLLRYKQQIIDKDLKLIRYYLDKKFLDKIIDGKLNSNDTDSILEDIKFQFKLDEIRFLPFQELEADKELDELFKDSLNSNESTIINKTDNNTTRRLYVFGDKKLIYIKAAYIMTSAEEESMNLFVRLAKVI